MKTAGFTLLELLTCLALAGVLAMIAMPAYTGAVNRGRVASAVADIASLSLEVERYHTDHSAYPETLSDLGVTVPQDPWGRDYRYYNIAAHGRGHARKDHALNPINRDFDLYSVGANGETHTQISQRVSLDDVIRGRDSSFVGLAADF